MKKVFQGKYKDFEQAIDNFIETFDSSGKNIKDARNKLKLFQLNDKIINIKSFRIPNLINHLEAW